MALGGCVVGSVDTPGEVDTVSDQEVDSALGDSDGVEVSSGVFKHGPFTTTSGQIIEVLAFEDHIDPEGTGELEFTTMARKGGKNSDSSSKCYATGNTKWRKGVSWSVDASGAPFDHATIVGVIEDSIAAWENESGRNIFGDYDQTARSLVSFGDFSTNSLVAVTYLYSRQHAGKYVPYRWSVKFNTLHSWATDGRSDAADFMNAAIHELGHAAGMGHAGSGCTEETMYPSAAYGETHKRDLHDGDIAGIRALY